MQGNTITTVESATSKKIVFLFKSPKENEPDKFEEVLRNANMLCASLPVLSFRFVNQEELKSSLNAIHLFSAIIFTSVRAVEAVAHILKEVNVGVKNWNIQSFAVGQTTLEAARKFGFKPKGESSGNAQALGEFILEQVSSDDDRPFLYPCSNLHQDKLKKVLNCNGKVLKEVIAYETCPNEQLKDTLELAIQHQGTPDYVVFFSPSSFQFAQNFIYDSLIPLNKVKIVAIGPTTEKAICDQGYTIFATAEKPDPQSLLKSLERNT
ncbi:uroporphyrinogen-iii synthase [Plakobranchus ocellatus]|uniref:Uroporphyrinogen-III synthase n=1 Tax=Plakobranchus ocellatus TaxID=259542 RepID=A0AAV4E1M5_9GAST|nr:uroporphyrinogen-iii synthase [Plakobranchus ocellatus]